MGVIILLIFFSMLVAGGFLAAFLWAVKSGQYDDSYTPSVRILFEEETIKNNKKEINIRNNKMNGEKNYDEILHSAQEY